MKYFPLVSILVFSNIVALAVGWADMHDAIMATVWQVGSVVAVVVWDSL
jgi:hypothetical protein